MMQVDSSYGWLVAPDPAIRARIEAGLEAAFAHIGAEPPALRTDGGFAALESEILVRRYISSPKPLYARLPFDYRLVPSRLRGAALAFLARQTGPERTDTFPRWPDE